MKNFSFLSAMISIFIIIGFDTACVDEHTTVVDNSWQETWIVASQKVFWGENESCGEYYWIKQNGDPVWKLFGNEIESFDYVEGYEYEIVVKIDLITGEIPQDASIFKYSLIEIISKEQKESDVPFLTDNAELVMFFSEPAEESNRV